MPNASGKPGCKHSRPFITTPGRKVHDLLLLFFVLIQIQKSSYKIGYAKKHQHSHQEPRMVQAGNPGSSRSSEPRGPAARGRCTGSLTEAHRGSSLEDLRTNAFLAPNPLLSPSHSLPSPSGKYPTNRRFLCGRRISNTLGREMPTYDWR